MDSQSDEVLRKVGANLVLLQQVEQLLKIITGIVGFRAPVSKYRERLASHLESIRKSTLGTLVGKFTDAVQPQREAEPEHTKIVEPWLGFALELSDAALKADAQDLVDRRNALVHHFLPRWNAAVNGDAAATLAWLDEQHQAALSMRDRLQTLEAVVKEHLEATAAFHASPEGQRSVDQAFLCSSKLVLRLGEIARTSARPDGWMLLAQAGSILHREDPTLQERVKNAFGLGTLRQVLLATELFNVLEEPATAQASRTVYRIKPELDGWPAAGLLKSILLDPVPPAPITPTNG